MHLSGDGANRTTDEAEVAVPVRAARIEAQAVGAVRGRRVLRRRPEVAVRAGVDEVIVPAGARRRQKDARTILLAREPAAPDSVQRGPGVGAVVSQLVLLNF